MLSKAAIFDALIAKLRADLQSAVSASKDAADYATNEESRAESKYDTQGLEASYLAAGQAAQARKHAEALQILVARRTEILRATNVCGGGSLVIAEIKGRQEAFFILSAAGGLEVDADGITVTVLSVHSPLAMALQGKRRGETFSLPQAQTGILIELF